MSNTKLFAVTGSPISNSKSPNIWNAVFESLNIDAVYFKLAANDISEAVKISNEIGLSGMNVTAPYKEEALKFANDLDKEVTQIGAANSFIFDKGRVRAVNTDWLAVHKILESRNLTDLKGKKVLVIGAGGAARAAIYALKKCNADIIITNRTEQKAKLVASVFNITHKPFLDAIKHEYEIIVSCVPYSEEFFDDFKFGLMIDASYHGLNTTNKYVAGEEWLVLQAESFFKEFFEVEPLEYLKKGLVKVDQKKENIALIGFMGAGKTLIGRILARELNYDFVDLDILIEQKVGMSVSEIFNTKGADYFRKMEKELLSELNPQTPTVVATGGGAVLDADNRDHLKKNFNVIWVWADVSSIYARVNSETRPLFKDNVSELLKHRTALYAETCDLCVSNCHKQADEVVKKIRVELNAITHSTPY